MTDENNNISWESVTDWGVRLLVGILAIILTFTITTITTQDREIVVLKQEVEVIKATHFMAKDAFTLQLEWREELDRAVDEIKECLNRIQRQASCN